MTALHGHNGSEIHHTQLRFSSRPMVATYPRWHYDDKNYLSDHDWRVDAAGAAGGSRSRGDTKFEFGPQVPVGRQGRKPAREGTAGSSRTKANALVFTNKPGGSDALEEYNFTVFKVAQRKKSEAEGASSSGSWWKSNQSASSANPYNLKKGKTISIHGETIFDVIERKAAEKQKELNSLEGGEPQRKEGKLFNVRDPPMKQRSAMEKNVVEKVRASAFSPPRPSTYVDITTKRNAKDGNQGPAEGGGARGKPGWVSSTLLEDTLQHSSPGTYNALKYVEQRNRKFALAQSVAKLNHKMKRHHEVRRLDDQKLGPLKETIHGLEKRQGVLEKENQELQQLVKELAGVIEEHQRNAQRQREAAQRQREMKKKGTNSGASKASRTPTRKTASRVSTSTFASTSGKAVGDGTRSGGRRKSDPRIAAGPSSSATVQKRPASAVQGQKKQRSQWRQPRTTAKQRAMSERTQAFQQAMSLISSKGEDSRDVQETLEAFARAQAEAELKMSDVPMMASNEEDEARDPLLDGLQNRLREVGASFLKTEPQVPANPGAAASVVKNLDKVVVVPTSGAARREDADSSGARANAGGASPRGAMDEGLRDDLMQAVQSELQRQIVQGVQSKAPPVRPNTGTIQAFMDDTNRKLEAISRHFAGLQQTQEDKGRQAPGGGEEERVVIVRPQNKRLDQGGPPPRLDASPSPKAKSSEAGSGAPAVERDVTFSTLKSKKNVAFDLDGAVPKQLIVGADREVDFVVDKRVDLAKLSAQSIRDIEEGREAFLRQQRQNDEFVYANAASDEFDPVKIAEKLEDLIIEDLLQDCANELSQVCDSICENVFEREFKKA
ncbi:hypothetical protein HOP50_04g34820 [Chloropicon primus]|uniref:Uncharacterized protein n=3 Tax=Chloropicon primus TaxID=1764295 RepID=A0A5B8MK07_9CHLO|nr:hypothetical protein A3770_04p34760 [Chloropicon primus]UPR00168.1 hypothetical protein HOP50_04g34820 [Chloropicon primus]|eukprot:QDZ20958.1 hypothetical protein A3770_04p34760 [Chloropicon primus]